MAQIVPQTKVDFLQFCVTHHEAWETHAAALGIAPAMVAAWKVLFGTAQSDFEAALIARNASKAATLTSDESIRIARAATAELVRLIKNHAISTGNPNVYALANIPAPTPPSELPPPAQPTDLRAVLNTDDGSLTVRWYSVNPKGVVGVVFNVKRRIGASGMFESLGSVGVKSITDDSVPRGTALVQYTVQGLRGTQAGAMSAVFSVFFGSGEGGAAFIARTETSAEPGEMKSAA